MSALTAEQQKNVGCADAWLRGQLLPSYSEVLSALAMFNRSEALATDRLSRERGLADARRVALDVLRRAGHA